MNALIPRKHTSRRTRCRQQQRTAQSAAIGAHVKWLSQRHPRPTAQNRCWVAEPERLRAAAQRRNRRTTKAKVDSAQRVAAAAQPKQRAKAVSHSKRHSAYETNRRVEAIDSPVVLVDNQIVWPVTASRHLTCGRRHTADTNTSKLCRVASSANTPLQRSDCICVTSVRVATRGGFAVRGRLNKQRRRGECEFAVASFQLGQCESMRTSHSIFQFHEFQHLIAECQTMQGLCRCSLSSSCLV